MLQETSLAYASVVLRQSYRFSADAVFSDSEGRPIVLAYAGPVRLPVYPLLFGVTTLAPVAALLAAVLFLSAARLFALGARSVALRFLDRATEPDLGKPGNFMPGTKLAVLFSLLGVIAKGIADLLG